MTNLTKLFLAGALLLAGCAPAWSPPPCDCYPDAPPMHCCPRCSLPCPIPPEPDRYAAPDISVSAPGVEVQVDGVPGVEVDVSL